MFGFIMFKNGTCRVVNTLSQLCGLTFVKKVGDQLLFCGKEPIQGQRETQCVKMFTRLLFGEQIECYGFPLVCYTLKQDEHDACLMETLLLS